MITVRPVLEIPSRVGFDLWPISDAEPYTFLALDGHLASNEVGTAVMALAACNDIDPADDRPPRPDDLLGGFLHGLLTMDPLFAAGGLEVIDTDTGTRVVPGCCSGLEDRGDWWDVLDGGACAAWFGHDPSPSVELHGSVVRLTADSGADTSQWIDLPATELRLLLAGAEQDLVNFLELAAGWAAERLPDHSERVSHALVQALTLPPRN
ncbi:hypothetical protein OG585_55450 (plasmid) [Streptomyces sp. NBC_01340]|uniref:hypothetical protein n=1 Tax=Streptomyces sp. NBC_01340 TaxID=2903830 RepID=UPI002E154E28|nr:hypothetical protein OG585_00030 [Streptomyces sp. NBC_01340]WSI43933.1 hypothetical protein OG585_46890 [Streptomyces sp. NBC_01340]WSI45868.1 hypothetical protein OG585_55450 [Streptomyces sp. NBC_01340]